MDIKQALSTFYYSIGGGKALSLLSLRSEQLNCFVEHGVGKNPFLFFRLARVLTQQGIEVDNFSNLPEANREAIDLLLDEKLTVEDYLDETHWARDTFMRCLKMSPGASTRGISTIKKASASLMLKKSDKPEPVAQQATENIPDPMFISKSLSNQLLISNLIIAISANCIALEKILTDFLVSSSEKDRIFLRDLLSNTGFPVFKSSNAVYRLSQQLNALCSEKARKNYKTN